MKNLEQYQQILDQLTPKAREILLSMPPNGEEKAIGPSWRFLPRNFLSPGARLGSWKLTKFGIICRNLLDGLTADI